MPEAKPPVVNEMDRQPRLFAALAGLVFMLVVVKLGNPVIFDAQLAPPKSLLEIRFMSWPVSWGYALLIILTLTGAWLALSLPVRPGEQIRGRKRGAQGFLWLPLYWLAWQGLAAIPTVDDRLTRAVLPHFAACAACFYLGFFALGRVARLKLFWIGLLAGFAITLWTGFDQKFGGLEETRRQFEQLPPELRDQYDVPALRDRMASNRIFSTFVYPNAFAGIILLLLPITVSLLWQVENQAGLLRAHRQSFSRVLAIILAALGLSCLFWSGSKAGWLIALVVLLAALLHWPMKRPLKLLLLTGVLAAGMSGFFLKYAAYFSRGATSASARLDYWHAAVTIAKAHPLLGTGPGTFFIHYKQLIKPPQAEMTRLVHNDFLQQACDSGVIGYLAYATFLVGSLVCLRGAKGQTGPAFAVWLGLLGWTAQGLVEFGLYIPALAWTAFLLLGWLWRQN